MNKLTLGPVRRYASKLIFCGLLTLPFSSVFAQCASAYNDADASGDTTAIYAWSVLTDNYTDNGTGCNPGWGNFTHTYSTSVQITSPTGRQVYVTNNGSQNMGEGQGINRIDTWLDAAGEYGDFMINGFAQIDCTIGGIGFFATPTSNSIRRGFSVSFYTNAVNYGSYCSFQIINPCDVKCRPVSGYLNVSPVPPSCNSTSRWRSLVDWTSMPPHGPTDYKCQTVGIGQSGPWLGAWPTACFDRAF
jgi:hypothetical protein